MGSPSPNGEEIAALAVQMTVMSHLLQVIQPPMTYLTDLGRVFAGG